MPSPKPTLVLIHGGWHTPTHYSKLTSPLRAAGYEVHIPRLLSVSETRPPTADLTADTDLIRSYVSSLVEAGRTVVVIMHSYGGQVGTNALHGLGKPTTRENSGGGVVHLIYMCASALPEGCSMMSKVREFGQEYLMPLAFDFADDGSCVCRDPKTILVGSHSDDDDAEVEKYVASLVRWNGTAMDQPLEHCAWREIPVSYVYATHDATLPLEYQKSMVERMQMEGKVIDTFELATGHCPNLTMAQEMADIIMGVAENQD